MRCHADIVSLGHYTYPEQFADTSTMCYVTLAYIHAASFEVGSTLLTREEAFAGLAQEHAFSKP